MKVFLDTNVLASALATRGLCADVLREVLFRHRLVTCETVLDELRGLLDKKFGVPRHLIEEIVKTLQEEAVLSRPGPPLKARIKDKADLPILSAALTAKVDVFVTGDKELVRLKAVEEMPILSPRAFWERVSIRRQ